jgi:hypothetical protein
VRPGSPHPQRDMKRTTVIRRISGPGRGTYAVALLSLVAGCYSAETPAEPEVPTLSLSIDVSTGVVTQGASFSLTASATAVSGYLGPVTLAIFAVTDLPAGATSRVSDIRTGATTTATVTIDVDLSVVPGTYEISITAANPAAASPPAVLALTVTAPH